MGRPLKRCLLTSVSSLKAGIYPLAEIDGRIHFQRHASHTSNSWLERQKRDIYKKMSRYDNYRARSAYKLIQIDDKFKFLKPGKIVIEAGAAPGSWTQVVCERLQLNQNCDDRGNDRSKGLCISIDLEKMSPVDGAICLGHADFTSPFTQGKILSWLDSRKADCVLSDMAPNCSGQKYLDHERVIHIVENLIQFATRVLKPGSGMLLFKIWDGNQREALVVRLKSIFDTVKMVKPDASRDDSSEMYIICLRFKQAQTS